MQWPENVIKELKAKHGSIYSFKSEELNKACILRAPNKVDALACKPYFKNASQNNKLKVAEIVVKRCLIYGDDPLKYYSFFISIVDGVAQLIKELKIK